MRFFVSLLLVLSPLCSLNCFADIYRWTDENGKTHYSDKPPAQSAATLKKTAADNLFVKQLKDDRGHVVLKTVPNGQFVQYLPNSFADKFAIVVVNHGMYDSNTNAEREAARYAQEWQDFAEKTGAIIIAPVFDDHRYAVTIEGPQKWGYRGLFGRYVGADEFLHEILDYYQQPLPDYDGKFFLAGHSAGAQFANRYLVRHPQRVHAAAFSAPAWFALPSPDISWPNGMKDRHRIVTWPGSRDRQIIRVEPDPNTWLVASQIPTTVVVGAKDIEPLRHEDGVGGDTHVDRAKFWVENMNNYASSQGKVSLVKLQLVDGVGHSSTALAPHCQTALQPWVEDYLVRAQKISAR